MKRTELDASRLGLSLCPFVSVAPDLRRIREVGGDLHERRPETGVEDVEIVDADPALGAGELEVDDTVCLRAVLPP